MVFHIPEKRCVVICGYVFVIFSVQQLLSLSFYFFSLFVSKPWQTFVSCMLSNKASVFGYAQGNCELQFFLCVTAPEALWYKKWYF